ncbi:MAG TPA: ATP-binding protein [Myxococcota bacterium]|jgi:signal transduction histidine kinase
MGPGARTRFRRWTAFLAIAWALASFVVGLQSKLDSRTRACVPFSYSSAAGVHVVNETDAATRAAGIKPRDRLISIAGRPVSEWMRRGMPELEVGQVLEVVVLQRDGRQLTARVRALSAADAQFPLSQLAMVLIPLVGLVYLVIGLGVWLLKPDRRESWVFLLFCGVTSALLTLVGPAYGAVWVFVGVTIPWVGATAFHLFTTYPIEPAWIVRHPQLRAVVYAAAALLSTLSVAGSWVGVSNDGIDFATTTFSVGLALLCLGIAITERLRRPSTKTAERADVMLAGGLLSFVPIIAAIAVHASVGTAFAWTLSMALFFLFPAAVGYGIVRRDLFDLRVVARSSAAYGAATLAITGVFAAGITLAAGGLRRIDVDARTPLFSVVLIPIAIFAFNPLLRRVQRFVDDLFDRERRAYRRAVREISEAMVSMLSAKEIVERILIAVTDTMGVERALVMLHADAGDPLQPTASRGDWDSEALGLELEPDHPVCRQLWMQRQELARGDFDDELDPETRAACQDVFDILDVELLVPILFGVDLLGIIAVGRKLTSERLGPDERQLLRTLANQSAIAIENAKAFDEIAQLNKTLEARVEERTRELRDTQAQLVQSEKMRSLGQLVAGVAHELNNPIGFVHANLQLLEEYVERLMRADSDPARRRRAREAIERLLARSQEGAGRVKQIVQDLRTFSRTDQAELTQVSLNEAIQRTLALMEPRTKNGIVVERDLGDLPEVRCYSGQLNQVFMNLLMNACDAMDGRGKITVRTRPARGGVVLEFQDNGPGMSPEVRSRIFEPFFTTKPVGKGTGLGLSISHGIVERHGGTMSVESAPGEGARFTIRLPLEPPAELAGASA